MASNVPKFASFRPKPKAEPVPPPEPKAETRDITSSKSRKSRHERAPPSRASEVPETKTDVGTSKIWFSDRLGDADVLRYGSLYRSDIPAYRRAGYGFVLGLGLDQKIDRERSSQGKIYMTPATRQRQERLLTGKHAPKEGTRMLRVVKQDDRKGIHEQEDFVRVSSTRKRKRDSGDEAEEQTPELDDRGIERDDHELLDPDTQYDSGVEDSSLVAEATKRNSELVRKTRESPQDVQAWLHFIEHQEAMLGVDHSALTENLRQRLADVRIPIYEEALKKVPSVDHVRLQRGLLCEAQRSWNGVKVASKFEEVLATCPSNGDIWLMYLDFVQSSFSVFKYESCRETFSRSLQSLSGASGNADVSAMLHIILRLTRMMQETGYQELALAVWQAILEFHVMQSPAEASDVTQSSSDFEQFWEAEAPRIGELGSNGWRKSASDDYLPNSDALLPQHSSNTIFKDFEVRETEAIEKLRSPGRTTDEVGEDDAFHTIFFSDLEGYLKLVPGHSPPTHLVEAFLCFCGLPSLTTMAEHQRTWWNDPFLSPVFGQSSTNSTTSSRADLLAGRVDRYSACGTTSIQTTTETLFGQSFSLQGVRLTADFVRRVLKLVVVQYANEDVFGEYLLAFESQHYPIEVVRTAKNLLKARPTSQRLYHAYGFVELQRGKMAKADQVFSMALSVGSTGTYESMMLLHSWVWTTLDNKDEVRAMWRLVSHTGIIPATQNGAARPEDDTLQSARLTLSDTCEKALLRGDHPTAVLTTSLLALLTYLTSSHDASASLAIHKGLSQWFTSHHLSTSPFAELNAQATARFLIYHASTAAIVKPALIRSAIEPLLLLFPNNTILLALYAANESRFAIDDRVRGIMSRNALSRSSERRSVAGWSFAIHFETLRGEMAGSTSHSIRAFYQRATATESSGAHSPALWTKYLRFEIAQLNIERARTKGKKRGKDGKRRTWESRLADAETRVKACFYAALRSLPWCKDFIMLAFTELGDVFDEEELWKVYRVMQEKELRLYIEME